MAEMVRVLLRCPIFGAVYLCTLAPDRMAQHIIQAETGGTEEVTLTTQQIPIHTHAEFCFSDGTGTVTSNPQSAVPGRN